MEPHALILGGTKGLGRSLAIEAIRRDIRPVVVGRSVEQCVQDEELRGALLVAGDIRDPDELVERLSAARALNAPRYVFWVAGIFQQRGITDSGYEDDQFLNLALTHFLGPRTFLREFTMRRRGALPYHLVTVSSTSSWRVRDNETDYSALQAAKAHWTRNFARELTRDLPGSKTTLVHPGGMKNPNFYAGTERDISGFMNPADVARIIWDRVTGQAQPFAEFQIIRNNDGSARVEEGSRAPASPLVTA